MLLNDDDDYDDDDYERNIETMLLKHTKRGRNKEFLEEFLS
jgi:hypothetical protein